MKIFSPAYANKDKLPCKLETIPVHTVVIIVEIHIRTTFTCKNGRLHAYIHVYRYRLKVHAGIKESFGPHAVMTLSRVAYKVTEKRRSERAEKERQLQSMTVRGSAYLSRLNIFTPRTVQCVTCLMLSKWLYIFGKHEVCALHTYICYK